MPATETTIRVAFSEEKETPGTIRYAEITTEERGVIGTLYIRKDVAEEMGRPEGLLITIEAV